MKNQKQTSQQSEAAKQAQLNRQKKKGSSLGFFSKYSTQISVALFGSLLLGAIISVMIPTGKKLTENVIVEEEIAQHNAQNYSFKIGPNTIFKDTTLASTQKLFLNQISHKQSLIRCPSEQDQNIIDLSFNFHTKYPQCVRPIANQGKDCSASYSIAAVSSVADRLCMASEGDFNFGLSAQPTISCYENQSYKCEGGYVSKTFQKGKTTGFVKEECLPYHGTDSNEGCSLIDKCEHFKIYDYCVSAGQESIKREIMLNGPVVSLMNVFSDFLVYKSGVYRVLENAAKLKGQQAVKIIGWDIDPLTKDYYWIIENSWGEEWGLNGLAYVAMGQEELRLEEYALAAITLQQAETASSQQAKAQSQGSTLNYDEI
ncbi:papain family cysteine protease (macronuclear) [Tetrahymena thermophila SB210]|uniref:Papain family cysteine protease n=1 Tax=Tetrahymena thermophila (strain SB210) TaxID=312017 RepID=I7LWS7_TETTS|nr:papain family cysteine protease [Tetrahymena thermophila SB210]EAS02776.2 papain family cysteine protease [Tetrahymena thermophila SB210]|eukprot:XP_001023021.2 papain family cysteine protease [Tetrahymena thermophila SB210]